MAQKCPWCGGTFQPATKSVDGYPMETCGGCNAWALVPVPGREPPFTRLMRALHDHGCEPGTDDNTPTPPPSLAPRHKIG